jgi:hypothetical protein
MRVIRRCGWPAAPAVASLVAAACAPGAQPPTITTITRHFTAEDRAAGRYQYVPFDVPAGVGRLHLQYAYDPAGGENVIDLGLFEPGSLDLGTPAFRGYSGGARREVVVSTSAASPGYRAGPLPPGAWHVLLGLYKVAPVGVDVTLRMELGRESPDGGPSVAAARAVTPEAGSGALQEAPSESSTGARWYSGALHTHTLHSDGAVSPRELLHKAQEAGLDFVVITDHNNTTHREELLGSIDDGWRVGMPLWIVGEEVTTPDGHASVWGLGPGEWVDFRVRRDDRRIEELVAAADRYGALFSVNHPVGECDGCGWDHGIPSGVDGIEIWNGDRGPQAGALSQWDVLVSSGRRITGVGSSDWHRDSNPVDRAHVRVYADALTEPAILDAIRAGRVIVMRAATDSTPAIIVKTGHTTAGIGDTLTLGINDQVAIEVRAPGFAGGSLRIVSNANVLMTVPVGPDATARVRRRLPAGYVRFELQALDATMVAVTNPVYLSVRQ